MDPNQSQSPQEYTPPQPPQNSDSYPGKGLCIASLVLGICAVVFLWTSGGGLALAIVGLVLGIMGRKKAEEVGISSSMGKAGMILSIIALAINVVAVIVCVSCLGAIGCAGLSLL